MIQNFYRTQNQTQQAGQNFLGAVGDLFGDTYATGIKTRVRGDMFNKKPNQQPFAPSTEESNRMAANMGLRDGGRIKSYQPGGTYSVEEINTALGDLGVRDEDYHQAVKEGRQDSADVNKVHDYIEMMRGTGSRGTDSNTQNNRNNSGFYTGPMGGFYFEDGQIKFGQPGTQGGQGMPGGFTGGLPAASSMQQLLGTYGAGAIGKAFQMMTPEDVYMSKFKTSAGIMGPRLVAKWKYKPDGSVERVGDMGDFSMFDDTENNVRDAFGNLTTEKRAMKSFQDPNYLRQMGRTSEESVSEDAVNRRYPRKNTRDIYGNLTTERKALKSFEDQSFERPNVEQEYNENKAIRELNRENRQKSRAARNMLNENVDMNLMPQIMQDAFEQQELQQQAYGGMAGKLVMRNKYAPSAGAIGRFASPAMDFASSLIEGAGVKENEAAYTPGNWSATLRSDMPMSRGVWFRGQEIPNLQPDYAEAYRFPQNPGEFTNTAPFNIGQNGGSFQYGGSYMDGYEDENEDVYYLDEDEIQDIMKRGGQIEYL
jgi:hypothetical protein